MKEKRIGTYSAIDTPVIYDDRNDRVLWTHQLTAHMLSEQVGFYAVKQEGKGMIVGNG